MTTAIAQITPADLISNELTTTSLKVADMFRKRHNDVTRKIEGMDCSDEFRSANFFAHPYINEQNGEKYNLYEMTKNGFMLLVMGFTGKKAMEVKEAYIKAFDWMADQLTNRDPIATEAPTQKALPKGLTLEQQDTIKEIVRSTAEALPKDKRASATIKMWSAIKTKYGCSYKEVPSDQFNNVVSLLARLPIEGELFKSESPTMPLNGRLSLVVEDGKITYCNPEPENSFRTTPETVHYAIRETPAFGNPALLKQIVETCIERLGRMVR